MKVVERKRSKLSRSAGTDVLFDGEVEAVSRTTGGKIRTWIKNDSGESFRIDVSVPEVLRLFAIVPEEELSEVLGEKEARSLVEALSVVESVYLFKEENL